MLVVGAPLVLAAIGSAPNSAIAADSARVLVTAIRSHLDGLAKNEGLSGVVLIAKDGEPIFEQAYGYSNLADHVPNKLDTKFNIASMGKMFTATAVLQLVEAKRLSLDETVGKYLPNYPNKKVRDQVTIRQLLTHTSGMGNFWDALAGKAKERYVAVSDYLPLFADQPLQFEPGKGFAYSNNGYTVLGLVIEAVTGKKYFDYIRDAIYRPCGMTATDAYELNVPVPNLAMGYSRSADIPGQLVSNIYAIPFKGSPAGGSYSTAADLLGFANALMDHKLLSAEDTDALTTGKVDYGKRRYAYGFTEEMENGHRLVGHGGGNIGIADELMIFADLGYTAVILTNGDVDNFWDIENFLKRSVMGPSPATESFDFTKSLIDAANTSGYDAGEALLEKDPYHPAVRAGLLEQMGYKLLWQSKIDQAVIVFRLYALASPRDAYAYLGLGSAYERAGDRPDAVAAYTKYLGFEPDDQAIKTKLQMLNKP
jgi:CubicO group peptidase (beta-lactamase class C family)